MNHFCNFSVNYKRLYILIIIFLFSNLILIHTQTPCLLAGCWSFHDNMRKSLKQNFDSQKLFLSPNLTVSLRNIFIFKTDLKVQGKQISRQESNFKISTEHLLMKYDMVLKGESNLI